MKAESMTMPAEIEVLGSRIVVRSNVRAVQRSDEDGKPRTVYQYDEVNIVPDGKTAVTTLLDRATKAEQGNGTAAVPKGAARVIIPHDLGFAPPHVSVSAIGAKVFTLGSEAILVILPSEAKSAGTLTWTAGAEPAGTLKAVDLSLASRVETAIASRVSEPVEEVSRG